MCKEKFFTLMGLALVTLWAIASCNFASPTIEQKSTLTVSAAASLEEVLSEIADLFSESHSDVLIRNNFGSSGDLQQQIINGAPVDVFISAATRQMDELQQKDLIIADTRHDLLGNRLVLIVPANELSDVGELKDLTKTTIKRVAIGDARSVPAGQYAEESLQKLGLWQKIQPKFVLGNNVRQVRQFVESGNAQAGFIYATDAKASPQVRVVQVIDPQLYRPIVYPIAILKKSTNQPSAKSYLEFLSSKPAKAIFEKYGFSTL